jgi:phenol 2-monooxygenase (NADPH)
MDAEILYTDMPFPRGLNSIDSKTHGQILWCPEDEGMVRVGYVFSRALMDKYGRASCLFAVVIF